VSDLIRIGVYDDCPPEEVARKTRDLPGLVGGPVEIYIMERSMEPIDCHLCGEKVPGLRAITDNDCLEGLEIGGPMTATIFCSDHCKWQHSEIGHDERGGPSSSDEVPLS
jgi:hypothetical protein